MYFGQHARLHNRGMGFLEDDDDDDQGKQITNNIRRRHLLIYAMYVQVYTMSLQNIRWVVQSPNMLTQD